MRGWWVEILAIIISHSKTDTVNSRCTSWIVKSSQQSLEVIFYQKLTFATTGGWWVLWLLEEEGQTGTGAEKFASLTSLFQETMVVSSGLSSTKNLFLELCLELEQVSVVPSTATLFSASIAETLKLWAFGSDQAPEPGRSGSRVEILGQVRSGLVRAALVEMNRGEGSDTRKVLGEFRRNHWKSLLDLWVLLCSVLYASNSSSLCYKIRSPKSKLPMLKLEGLNAW